MPINEVTIINFKTKQIDSAFKKYIILTYLNDKLYKTI